MSLKVSFPNIEALCVQFLSSEFAARGDSVHVSTRMPSPRPEKAVRVTRTGGGRTNVGMDAPQVLFECWASSDYESSELARITRALVGSMDSFGSEMGSVVNYPDGSGLPRYQSAV